MTKEMIAYKEEPQHNVSIIEQVVIQGDLSKLSPIERVTYYKKVCESMNLNPLTKPFDYILLNGKLTLYATKNCTEQLRKLNGVSIEGLDDKVVDDLYIVKAKARDKSGRLDESTGAVNIGNLKGEAKANAIMKAETKAKRRVTLSISGLGWCDETEVDSIAGAQKVPVNLETGEISVQCEEIQQKKSENAPNIIQKPKISANELRHILELEAQVDAECKKNFKAFLLEHHQVNGYNDYCEIPMDAYAACIRGLSANININKKSSA